MLTYTLPWAIGFHEDGFTSGIRVAQDHLGAQLPFEIQSPDRRTTRSLSDVSVDYMMRIMEVVRRILAFILFSVVLGFMY